MESNQMQVFQKEEFGEVRMILIDNKPWFVAKDVGCALGIGNIHTTLASLYDVEKGFYEVETLGGKQKIRVISESGLYHVLFTCAPRHGKPRGVSETEIVDKEEKLKKFRLWVTDDILPSIREHGAYALDGSFEKHVLDLIQKNNENFAMLMESQNKIIQGLVCMNERINNLEQHTVTSPTLAQTVAPAATTTPVNQSAALPCSEPSISKQEFINTVTSKFVQKPCIKGMIFFLTGHNPKTISVRDQSVSVAFNYMYSQLVTVFGLNWSKRAPAQTKVDRLTLEDFVHCAEICYDAMLKKNLDPIEFINQMSA